jgi:hypothetical protein
MTIAHYRGYSICQQREFGPQRLLRWVESGEFVIIKDNADFRPARRFGWQRTPRRSSMSMKTSMNASGNAFYPSRVLPLWWRLFLDERQDRGPRLVQKGDFDTQETSVFEAPQAGYDLPCSTTRKSKLGTSVIESRYARLQNRVLSSKSI